MISTHQIDNIIPLNYFYNNMYLIDDYFNKEDFKWYGLEHLYHGSFTDSERKKLTKTNKIEVKIKKHLGEQRQFVFVNERLKEEKYDAFEFSKLYLNLDLFFSNLKFYEVIEFSAILFKELPFVNYSFYEIGEKYGYKENTLVKFENKIIKSFNVINNEKIYSINDYFIEYKSRKNNSEINIIVEEYLDNLNYEYEIYNNNLIQ